MVKGVDQVAQECGNYKFIISINKTETVYQPAPVKTYKKPAITVKNPRASGK